jgi:hypothetical protein
MLPKSAVGSGQSAGKSAAGSGQPAARRILLIRSGRHLRLAIGALRTAFPGCEIGVVGTAGSEGAIATAGIAPYDAFIYTKRPRLQPLSFFFSTTALRVRRWRYDQVAILWNDPEGTGQGNVDRTALVMSPRGFLAITPDGTIVERSPWPQIHTEVRRTVASIGVGAALGALLYLPAAVLAAFRPTHRPASAFAKATADKKAGPYEGGRVAEAAFRRLGN